MKNFTKNFKRGPAPKKLDNSFTCYLLSLLVFFLFSLSANAQKVDKLEQYANGSLPNLNNKGWVTGNVVESKAHFTECMTIPYRLEASGLSIGTPYRIKIGYDTKKGGAHAIDYLTTWDFDNNHDLFGHPQEPINPFEGLAINYAAMTMDSEALATPTSTPTDSMEPGVGTQPTTKFLSLAIGDRQIIIYGGDITNVEYLVGDENDGDPDGTLSSYMTVDFVPDSSSILLLWGGHIASTDVWGEGFAATNINGSPYHMFLEDCTGLNNGTPIDDLDGCGNKEVQLSASAVQSPPTCEVSDEDNVCAGSGNIVFTASTDTGESFVWELINTGTNASIVGSNTNPTLTVNPGTLAGTFEAKVTISLGVPGGSLSTSCSDFVTVYENPMASAVATDVSCNGGSNGSIDLTVNGGTPAYTYLWTTGDGSIPIGEEDNEDPTGLTPGTYNVTVTDANGCTDMTSAIVDEPPALQASDSHMDVLCNGESTGSVTITFSGGTGPYEINFDGGGFVAQTSPKTYTGLAADTYSWVVRDANGCEESGSETVGEPPALQASDSHLDVLCNGESTGSVTITFSGGTGPYEINFDGGGFVAQTSPKTYTGLAADTYSWVVRDANGCEESGSETVGEPPALQASDSHMDTSCNPGNDGSVTITFSGGTGPYEINFDGGGFVAQTSPKTYTGLTADTYSWVVRDANGCEESGSETVGQPSSLEASDSHMDVLCNGESTGSVTITFSGGTGPYEINFDGGGFVAQTSPKTYNGLAADTYSWVVRDANGCETSGSETVGEPPLLTCSITNNSGVTTICLDESVSLSASPVGGTPGYTYKWTSSDGSAVFLPNDTAADVSVSGLSLGSVKITVTIKDSNQCETSCDIDIISERCVDQCTWTPGFWKTHPEEICGLLGGTVTKYKGTRTCTGESQNIGFELCGTHYTLSAEEISCLFDYSSNTRGNKTPPGCTADVVAIAEYFAPFPNGENLLHHILAAKLNLLYNGADFGNINVSDLICIDVVNGVNVPDIFNGVPDGTAGEICAIDFCLSGDADAAELSAYIAPLTAFNECNNTCGLPSQVVPSSSEQLLVQESSSSMTLKAYPVPFKDVLNVEYRFSYDTDVSIRFYDLRGVLVMNKDLKSYKKDNQETASFDMRRNKDQVLLMVISTDKERSVKKIISTNRR